MNTVIIDKALFDDLVHNEAKRMREDDKTRTFSKKEAKERLGCSSDRTFYKHLNSPDCSIKRAKTQGRFMLKNY